MSTVDQLKVSSSASETETETAERLHELQHDLERRVKLLGPSTNNLTSNSSPLSQKSDLNLNMEGNAIHNSGEHVLDATPRKSATVPNKNILLAKIMAAQERAKEVQQHKSNISSPVKISEAINTSMEDESKTLATIANKEKVLITSQAEEQDGLQLGHDCTPNDDHGFSVKLSSTDIDVDGKPKVFASTHDLVPVPSAPPLVVTVKGDQNDSLHVDFIDSIPVPLSLDSDLKKSDEIVVSSTTEADLIMLMDFDSDGRQLSAEEKVKLIEEQRLIFERIRHESQMNDAAIATAQAEAFDARVKASVTGAATRSMNSSTAESTRTTDTSEIENTNIINENIRTDEKAPTLVDIGGGKKLSLYGSERTMHAIKDGTAILVQCSYCEEWMQIISSAKLMYCPKCKVISEIVRQTAVQTKEEALQLMLDRKLAKDMQEKENLRARTQTATLNRPLENRRNDQIAQSSENNSSYLSSLFTRSSNQDISDLPDDVNGVGGRRDSLSSSLLSYPGNRNTSNVCTETDPSNIESRYLQDASFWSYLSSFLPFSGSQSTPRSSDIAVSRPPGASLTQQYMIPTEPSRYASPDAYDESERLIQRNEQASTHENANIWDSSPARVGEQQPLLSCVLDSISHTALALGSVISSRSSDADAVDRTSLLVQHQTPRTSDEAYDIEGSYHQISDN